MKNEVIETTSAAAVQTALSSQDLLNQWQGHRRLTRRAIEAFPEKELFSFSVAGMRPFADLAKEMLGMAKPGMDGIITRKWDAFSDAKSVETKDHLLAKWDETTAYIDENWSKIPEGRFHEDDVAFGQWPGKIYWMMMYFVDNEIHHRGQGYVYLRALGIEPPHFWER
ncbi:MAG TPA: DinB family protein [Chryseolinea sp.]|nr:DinB family protein [Chryseolinea sp.]